ncbi:MAG: hypothetical protein ABSB42_03515 [Tepidisphaeraceae bacterium]
MLVGISAFSDAAGDGIEIMPSRFGISNRRDRAAFRRSTGYSQMRYREGAQRERCPHPKEFYREGAKDAKMREVKSNLVFSSRNFASFAPSR